MNGKLSRRQMYISIVSLVLAVVVAVGAPAASWAVHRQNSPVEFPSSDELPPGTGAVPEGEPEQPQEQEYNIIHHAVDRLKKQEIVDEMLQAELESGSYTFEAPLVVLDPYGESPLTALILFETEEPSKIEITIPGEDEDTSAMHIFDEVSTRHTIPVYGLYPDQLNEILLKLLSQNGEIIAENVVEIQTEPLPEWLDNYIILTESYGGDYENGINYMTDPGKFAFDKNGTPRWFMSETTWVTGAWSYDNHHWLMAQGSYHEGDVLIYELDLLGKIHRIFYTPYGVHHDVAHKPNGNLLITSSHGETVEDYIVEMDAKTGEIVYSLDLKTVLQRTRFGTVWDWCHNNSIAWDEQDNTIIISSNTQCTVAKLSWPEGEVKWLLSDPIEYMPRLQQYLLQPIDENFEYSYNQHHATILPDYDNDPDTVDILLFDNGKTRFDRNLELQRAVATHEIAAPENYSRLVHYRIDEKNMTVEQIWQYGKERGAELFSHARGSAQLLFNNNLLGCFNRQNDITIMEQAVSSHLAEVNRDGNLIWDAELFSKSERGNLNGYRAFRYPIYFSDDQEQDILTEAQNLIPQEILDRNQ